MVPEQKDEVEENSKFLLGHFIVGHNGGKSRNALVLQIPMSYLLVFMLNLLLLMIYLSIYLFLSLLLLLLLSDKNAHVLCLQVLQGGGLESPTKPKGRPKKNSIPSCEQVSEQERPAAKASSSFSQDPQP